MRHLLLLVVAGILLAVAPASAEVVIDESWESWIDTGDQKDLSGTGMYRDNSFPVRYVVINDISKAPVLNYVVFDISQDSPLSEGRTLGTYVLGGETKNCAYDVVKSRNLLGKVTSTKITLWFYDWSIGTLTGKQKIQMDKTLWTTSRAYDYVTPSTLVYPEVQSNYEFKIPGGTYKITYSTGILWKNSLKVSEVFRSSYSVEVQKVFNSVGYYSTLNCYDSDGQTSLSVAGNVDTSNVLLQKEVALVEVVSPTKSYSFPLSEPEPPEEQSKFSLSLSSPEATNYAPVTATLTAAADAPEYDEIAWIHGDEQRTFSRSADGWKEFNYDSLQYDIESDEHTAHNYQFEAYCPPGVDDPEDLVICCLYSQGKQIAELTGRVEIVSGSTKTQLAVVVVDYTDGQTPVLFGADVEVRDEKTKQLQQETGSDETFHRFVLEKGRRYIVTADAPGYKSSSRTITATKDVQSTEIYLSKEAPITAPDNSTQIGFVVTDGQYRHVEGALIRLSDQTTGSTLSGLTNQYGALTFLVDRTHQYRYAVSKTGYIGVQGAADLTGTTTVRLLADGDGLGGDQPRDSRTIDQKATSALGILFDHVELIAALAGLILVCNMLTWILPGGGRRR